MRYLATGRTMLAVLVACGVTAALAGPQGRGNGKRPTLDELTAYREKVEMPDGTTQYKRSFRAPIPWEEYVAALEAEQAVSGGFTEISSELGEVPITQSSFQATGTTICTPPDSDYDGDSFVGTTDVFPLHAGEYVADRPRVVANFTSYIEPGIDVLYTGSQTTTFESIRFFETDLVEKTEVVETREIKKKFNSGFAFKWVIARGLLPVISLDLTASGSYERSHDYKWTRTKTRSMEEKFTDVRKKQQTNTLSFTDHAGKVSGQVMMSNLSDYAIDVDISNIRIAVVAYSPFTGEKLALGDVPLPAAFTLGFGQGNNSATAFVLLPNLNTWDMLNHLAEGWVFDMEMASYTAIDHNTGTSLSTIISRVNQRNSRLSIHYGDITPRQFGQVSVFQPNLACLTGKDLLTQYVGAANVEFDRLADGSLVVKRIFHRENHFADRDFDTLTPEEQAQYGRWVVGFDYYTQLLQTFDLETTLLAPEDRVYFYYVTAADFVEPPPLPDSTTSLSLANDGTRPASQMVGPISTFDTIEVTAESDFQIESAYSQSAGNVSTSCGFLYGATYFGRRVTTDSAIHSITVPNVDWYGLQLNIGGLGWRTLASILADPTTKGTVVSTRGYPDYDFTVRFLASPSLLNNYPSMSLQVRSANPRQSFSVGYEGYDVLGRRVVCRHPETGGFYRSTGDVKLWYKLDNTDLDLDSFYATSSTGIDFDDGNARRFPYAPEHLDGIDNDGDTTVDESPLECPAGLRSYDLGTCVLDDRMDWYPPSPNTLLEQRSRLTNGTYTAWTTVGSGLTSYVVSMPSDATVAALQIRTTYYPAAGGSFAGVNEVLHLPGGDEPPLFSVGQDIEAEAGRVIAPMRVDTAGTDQFIHVPVGTPAFASALAEYRVMVTQTGDYLINTRVYATSSSDDSFLVTVLDSLGQGVDFGFGTVAHFRFEVSSPPYSYGAFNWTRVGHWNPYVSPEQFVNPIYYHLLPGTYTIRIQPRELGSRLDKFRVERNCPDNDGDGRSICQGDCNDSNPNVYPGHSEVCSNSIDDDCDGYVNEGCGSGGGGGSPALRKIME